MTTKERKRWTWLGYGHARPQIGWLRKRDSRRAFAAVHTVKWLFSAVACVWQPGKRRMPEVWPLISAMVVGVIRWFPLGKLRFTTGYRLSALRAGSRRAVSDDNEKCRQPTIQPNAPGAFLVIAGQGCTKCRAGSMPPQATPPGRAALTACDSSLPPGRSALQFLQTLLHGVELGFEGVVRFKKAKNRNTNR